MGDSRASRGAIIALAIVFAAAAGAAARLLSGNALLQTDLVYSPARKERIPGAGSPEDAARSFYLYVDAGMYDEAYDTSLEASWVGSGSQGEGRGEKRFSGWTSKRDFVDRLNVELGPGGSNIRLGSVKANRLGPLDVAIEMVDEPGRSPTGELLSRIERLEGAFRVEMRGHMLGACSVFRWKKDLVVVKSDGRYRVLLDGTRGERGLFYRTWFENVEKLADLRSGGNSRGLE
jgi:hypothetical protein